MKFSDKTIEEFIAAYERVYGEKLSHEEAVVILGRLVRLYRVLLRPLPQHQDQSTELQ